jgi:hypothetical protein
MQPARWKYSQLKAGLVTTGSDWMAAGIRGQGGEAGTNQAHGDFHSYFYSTEVTLNVKV